jgi:aminoglycoside 6'-N-acetyltransferase
MIVETSSGTIAFRRLAHDDLAELFDWLCRPHVKRGYASAPSSYAEVVARYGPRADDGNAVRAHIVLLDGARVGYAQHYALDAFPEYAAKVASGPRTAAVGLLIGEEALTGNGLGPRAIRRYVEDIVLGNGEFDACIAAPVEGDARAIRAFEKAGFRRWKSIAPDDGPPECVMRLDRG